MTQHRRMSVDAALRLEADEPARVRELMTWAETFAGDARRLLAAIEGIESRARRAVLALASETLQHDQHNVSLTLAPRFDLTPSGPATRELATTLRLRERVLSTCHEAIGLARQAVDDLDLNRRAAEPARSRLRMALSRKATRAQALVAVNRLQVVRTWADQRQVSSYFAAAEAATHQVPSDAAWYWDDVQGRPGWYAVQLGAKVGPRSDPVVASSQVGQASRLARELAAIAQSTEAVTASVRRSFDLSRNQRIRESLAQIPLARVKDVTAGRLRLGALESQGFTTIQQVLDSSPSQLTLLPGVGEHTAQQVYAAAQQLAKAVAADVRFRITLDPADPGITALVQALYVWDRLSVVTRALGAEDMARFAAELQPLASAQPPERGLTVFLPRSGPPLADTVRDSIEWIDGRDGWSALDVARGLSWGFVDAQVAWDDFAKRSVEYYTLLGQLVDLKQDAAAEAGRLPAEIVAKVHAQPLDDTLCRVSLRGYQSFGARFSLVQRRVIIGDEMGLGKTVQAIAVLAHLKARSADGRLLVVCPASVLVNWTREVSTRSALRVHRVHGPDRDETIRSWRENGDVAVTTFETLRALDLSSESRFALVVVDEAHFLKNPATQRSRTVRSLLTRADRALFLTGTPLENRLEEFRTLVEYLQPALVEGLDETYVSPQRFRELVAPAYLRRNQRDVLDELPEIVISEEWEEFSAQDLVAYRRAVAEGNFMAMRRAAFAEPRHSAKLARLKEIVDEAGANGHKIIVFSYFHDVLEAVGQALPAAYGPLTGSLSPTQRQELVDRFAAAGDGAVLLSQIQTGGVGLNMQAGSVVILCEPQVTPTLEAQAIARAYRMGQVRGVQVHRLLTPEGVDQRMVEMLDSKQRLFDEYVRRSDIADASPEAVDISDSTLAKTIVEQEQQRFAMGDAANTEPRADPSTGPPGDSLTGA